MGKVSQLTFPTRQQSSHRVQHEKGNKPDYITSLQNATNVKGYHELPESEDCPSFCVDMIAFVKQYMDMGCKTFQEMQHKYLMALLSNQDPGTQEL